MPRRRFWRPIAGALLGLGLTLSASATEDLDPINDALAFERQLVSVVDRAAPATVGLRCGGASGSGVVVNADGLILTAGHVVGRAGRDVTVLFPDGRQLPGKSLGVNERRDSGMVQLSEIPANLPFVPIAPAGALALGDWCVSTGHPGGFDDERATVVRIGRVQDLSGRFLHTDCPIIHGDSGGPLFDLQGRVVGIHSRIENNVTGNYHVPMKAFRSGWQRLLTATPGGGAKLGLWRVEDVDEGLRIDRLFADRPAAEGGVEPGDILTRFGGERIGDLDDLQMVMEDRRPGDLVELEVLRGEERLPLFVVLAAPQKPRNQENAR